VAEAIGQGVHPPQLRADQRAILATKARLRPDMDQEEDLLRD